MEMTFIVITRNRPTQLRRCIDSIRNLYTDPIVVIDNSDNPDANVWLGSTDNCIRHFNETPLPPGESRNLGVEAAKTDSFFFLDDDAWLETDIKGAIEGALASHPDIGVVGFPIWEESINKQLYGLKTGFTKCFAAGAVYIKREPFEKVGGFDPLVAWSEEFDVSLRLWGAGCRIWTAPRPMVKHHAVTPLTDHSRLKIEQIAFSRLISYYKSLSAAGALLLGTRMMLLLGLQGSSNLRAVITAFTRFLKIRQQLIRQVVPSDIERMFRQPDLLEDEFSIPLYQKLLGRLRIGNSH